MTRRGRGRGARDVARAVSIAVLAGAFTLSPLAGGCITGRDANAVDVDRLSPELREDYAVFALRCSKCHTLDRPLQSGIDNDAAWVRYVTRMRRQPASGISERDAEAILRFLHVLVEHQRAAKAAPEAPK